ncbi:hypothetical protein [Nocardia salmonicida]|uniref:hypothetical protein n=1 Tax=Nocardia salmonicida TaxID=53431 RepID=UPI00379D6816
MNDENRFQMFAEALIHNLAGLAKILGMLPIPIAISTDSGTDHMGQMLRVRKLVGDIPMNEVLTAAINTAIVDWMTGAILESVRQDEAEGDEKDFLLTSALLSMHRCNEAIQFALGILHGDIVIED